MPTAIAKASRVLKMMLKKTHFQLPDSCRMTTRVTKQGAYSMTKTSRASAEPWFQLISGVLIVAIALWMAWRTWKESQPHDHHHHDHDHHHNDHDHHHDHHHHHHEHSLVEEEWQDAHQRAHAQDINRRFSGQNVTTGQIVMFGLTGVFGKLAAASPAIIVFGRAAFAVLALAFFARFARQSRWQTLEAVDWRRLLLSGLLLAGHWVSFFISVKVAGVAIATLGFASFPAFTVILEGLLFRERIRRNEIMLETE